MAEATGLKMRVAEVCLFEEAGRAGSDRDLWWRQTFSTTNVLQVQNVLYEVVDVNNSFARIILRQRQ